MASTPADPQNLGTYQYDSLDKTLHQIRLVHPQPLGFTRHLQISKSQRLFGDKELQASQKLKILNQPIECHLQTVDLDLRPDFEALSYEWGSPDELLPIIINGKEMLVRENLWWALSHLRHDMDVRVIWIDAICITQESIEERNHQVAQMGRIYSCASHVVAWIGHEQGPAYDLKDAILCLLHIYKHKKYYHRLSKLLHILSWPRKAKKFILKDSRKQISLCYKASYWSRLWIFQEAVLAKKLTIQFDNIIIPWTVFSEIFEITQTIMIYYLWPCDIKKVETKSVRSGHDILNLLDSMRRRIAEHIESSEETNHLLLDISLLVYFFRTSQCQDPRDRVFGLLGVCMDCCAAANSADYSLDVQTISLRLLRNIYDAHEDRVRSSTEDVVMEALDVPKH